MVSRDFMINSLKKEEYSTKNYLKIICIKNNVIKNRLKIICNEQNTTKIILMIFN